MCCDILFSLFMSREWVGKRLSMDTRPQTNSDERSKRALSAASSWLLLAALIGYTWFTTRVSVQPDRAKIGTTRAPPLSMGQAIAEFVKGLIAK